MKPLKRRGKAWKVLLRSARVEREEGTLLRSLKRRKALKGEAQERWELKEASKGCEAKNSIERVAKP
jgi:hypothetical protein